MASHEEKERMSAEETLRPEVSAPVLPTTNQEAQKSESNGPALPPAVYVA
jgi:hypothetical protein